MVLVVLGRPVVEMVKVVLKVLFGAAVIELVVIEVVTEAEVVPVVEVLEAELVEVRVELMVKRGE